MIYNFLLGEKVSETAETAIEKNLDNINTKEEMINNVQNTQNNNLESNMIDCIKEEKNIKDIPNNIDVNLNKANIIKQENIIISSNNEEIEKNI